MNVEIIPATTADAKALVEIQRKAFKRLYEIYKDEGSPYLRGTDEVNEWLERPNWRVDKILADGALCGGVSFCERNGMQGVYYLARIYVLPELHGKGIASSAILLCEQTVVNANLWTLDYPVNEAANRRCYEKAGYADTGERRDQSNGAITLAIMEKRISPFRDAKRHISNPIIQELLAASTFEPTYEKMAAKTDEIRQDDSRELYIWVENGYIYGVCGFIAHPDHVEILNIAVAENTRSRGYGSAMIAALCDKYGTAIHAETDDDAVGFYQKCGFETTEIHKQYGDNKYRRWVCVLSIQGKSSLTIRPVECEQDFVTMLAIESAVASQENPSIYTSHPSHLVFDRYMYGNGSQDIFTYGKLVVKDNVVIGYVLAYLAYPDETEFVVRLLPQYAKYYAEVVKCIEDSFSQKSKLTVIANDLNISLCEALIKNGFIRGDEERWQSGLDLIEYDETEEKWQDENISYLLESDIDSRVTYADIPTGKMITRDMYETLIASEYYNAALDYVIRSTSTNEFIGFVTWWIDENSKTAMLEPVACLPYYRRRGIMKRALLFGLNELKRRGLRYAYVSTSIHNEKSQPLYQTAGFKKIGIACRWVKEITR